MLAVTTKELERIVTANTTAIAYLERTVAALEESFTAAKDAMTHLRHALQEPEFYENWEVRIRYHEREAKFLRQVHDKVNKKLPPIPKRSVIEKRKRA